MGLGDQLIATGLARGAAKRGKKIAFGNGHKLIWDHNSEQVFRGNPNIAFPGQERGKDVEWIAYYKGWRVYNKEGPGHWEWNTKWKCIPGEIFLNEQEKSDGERCGKGYVVIEPNVEAWKPSSPNKDWGRENYQAVVSRLTAEGIKVVQFEYQKSGPILRGAKAVRTRSFRDAISLLRNASLYLGAEGGLHHGSAAVGTPAVVLFGGFIPPSVTGYDTHINLTGGEQRFCGSFTRCKHCIDAMARISQNEVYEAVRQCLG